MEKKKRIHALDEIRGFCVFCMVFFHCFFTMGFMYGGEISVKLFRFFSPIQPCFAAAFIIICGISCHLSHNNLMRGLIILGISLGVTAVSLFIMPEAPISFGILHLLSVSILLYVPLKKLFAKIPLWLGLSLCVLLFFLTYNLQHGNLLFEPFEINLPKELYSSNYLMIFGFIAPNTYYSDYFPLMPWLFAFLFGTFLGRFAKEEKFAKFMYKARIPFLSMLGQNALLIYVLHQPIAYGIYYLLSLLGGIPQ